MLPKNELMVIFGWARGEFYISILFFSLQKLKKMISIFIIQTCTLFYTWVICKFNPYWSILGRQTCWVCREIMTLMYQDLLLAFTKVYGSLKGEIFEKGTFNSIARARRVPTPLLVLNGI